jgi:pilus assembly protein CpaB
VRAQVGPLVSVVVARKQVARDEVLTPAAAFAHLTERRVPGRFVPSDSLRSARHAIGLRALVRIPTGSYVGEAQLGPPRTGARGAYFGRREARLVEVRVSGAAAVRDFLRPRAPVDVLITSERGPGPPRTYLALQRVELVDLRPAGEGDSVESPGARAADAVAALRVTLRQAVLLTAAQNFARELRLVPRPAGDGRRFPSTVVSSGDLHP